jgi:hypothetical protein
MPALLTAISDKSCFQLVKLAVGKDFLLDEDKRSKEVLLVFVGNVIVMDIFVIEHVFNFVHDCCDSLALIDLERFFLH